MAISATAVWLAATKLAAPARRKDALVRPRLTEALAKALEHSPLILVSAPAGAGKTTLLADLPRAFPETIWSWLLLDAEDNDPSRFAAALVASLTNAGITIKEDSSRPGGARLSITAIINQIAQDGDRHFGIVLDDLHQIFEPSVHELLDYLINNLPPNLRVVVASRHDPPLGLPRRRARGEVAEIRLQDLSFSEDETRALANQCLGLNLTSQEVNLLHSRTEGWAAGLRLLATSLSQLPANRTALLQSDMQGSRRIFDFLAEEVLDRQEPDLRNFLLETSILTLRRPDVCDGLTGRHDSNRVLEDLYRRSLYVVAADEAETSFRYHDLFADFLRERLRRERPDQWAELHQRAARSETSPSNRLRHWLAAANWDAAAAEIEAIGPEYARRGFVHTLQRWISELPDEARLRRPRILYLLGHAIWTQSEFSQAQPYLEQALEGFRRNQDIVGQGETLVALANSAVMNNRFGESREMIREALALDLPDSGRVQLHSASAWDAIYRQDWPEALEHLDQVFQMLESGAAISNPMALMSVLFAMGLPGYTDRLESVCSAMLQRLSGPPDLAHGCYYMLNSAVLLNRGDMDGAYRDARKSFAIASDRGQILLLNVALSTNFRLTAAARGDWADMEAWSNDCLEHDKYGQIMRNWRLHSLYQQARARWHSGNLDGLRATYEEAMRPNPVEAPAARPYRYLIRGMLRLAERASAQAEQAFREALREEEGFRVTRAISSARVMLAYTLLLRGQVEESMEVFKPYLEEAEASNLTGYLTRENPLIIPLLRQAHQRNMHRAYAGHVLERLGAPLNAIEAAGGGSLSDRELEVLRVMAEGLANRDIAQRLFVSEATVKTHVQRIMRKLDGKTRTQAVARARGLMLL
jgi:LuxR family maltose regulon positive regulatory protein